MSVEGTYECVLETPLGKKSGSLVVVPSPDGEHFTGTLSNALLGTIDIAEGTIDGDMLLCQLSVAKPMRMEVECEVIVDGDALVGFITAGRFGEMKLSGRRMPA
jgi:hypothetical protein